MTVRPLPVLSMIDTRVLGVLVEKERTVPDTYPLTLNALLAGCNQKTSRDPVIDASESDVQAAIDTLRRLDLVFESSGGRVMRYAQNVKRVLQVPSESVALLAALMLRGPQTAAELRMNCDRLHRFSDVSSVQGYLDELARRPAGPLVAMLGRQPGSREHRWMHLLAGAPAAALADDAEANAGTPHAASHGELSSLRADVQRLEAEVAALRRSLVDVRRELGLEN